MERWNRRVVKNKGGDKMNAQTTIVINKELKEKSQKKAKEKGLSLAAYIRLLLSEDVNK